MKDFNELGLPEALMQSLAAMKFTTPTPIQAQAIPAALEGKDILGSAQTGTGKTGAFGIPLVASLLNSPRGTALVMTPTRELALQVMQQLKALLGQGSRINTALLIGGEAMPVQLKQLRNRPRLIVGTPGRINDHLERGNLMLHDTGFLVLDETDRMLDMGFTVQIERILKFMPKKRQTLLFSATLPKNIVHIANTYLNDPVRVAVAQESAIASNIEHAMVPIAEGDKYNALLDELNNRSGSVIVFMKTKFAAEKMADKLCAIGHQADAIHGDLRQNKRDRVIAGFRAKRYRILVATDIAARGLDIPHVEHVINYDLPQCPEDYVHRIGRTARAGAAGSAMCFVTARDKGLWQQIHRILDPEAAKAAAAISLPASINKGKGKKRPAFGKPRSGEQRSDDRRGSKGGEQRTASFGAGKPAGKTSAKPAGRAKPATAKPASNRKRVKTA